MLTIAVIFALVRDLDYDLEEPIFALATPWAESALAIVRTSGEGVVELLSPMFSRPEALKKAQGHTLVYGWLRSQGGENLDEVTLAVFRGTRSYTGQESVEILCHGSLPGLKRILEALQNRGFRPAGPGEFTLRAFVKGKLDLTQAEAVNEIIQAKSIRAQSLALNRLGGGVQNRIQSLKLKLLDFSAQVNLQLDYAEDDAADDLPLPLEQVLEVQSSIKGLLDSYQAGRIYQEGVKVVLAGRTNAGKSSLFNLFLKEDRSIVSLEHGTTRDYLESWITLRGIPIRLYDTAGLRQTENWVEAEGIRRSESLMEGAQVILYLVDASHGLSPEDLQFLNTWKDDSRLVCLANKWDAAVDKRSTWLSEWGFLPLSALTGEGLANLEQRLELLILGASIPSPDQTVIDSLRQKNLLERASIALDQVVSAVQMGVPLDMMALDLREAMTALGEITGEITTEDMLSHMFSNFCVGK